MKAFEYIAILLFVVVVGVVLFMVVVPFTGNMDIIDTTYRYEKAVIKLPDGNVIAGKVTKWVDYESDAVQVEIGGKKYLTHYNNVVLISE